MKTLWDLLSPRSRVVVEAAPVETAPVERIRAVGSGGGKPRATPMRDRYDEMTRAMLREHQVRVRKWRSSMSGVAWQVTYRDGRVSRLIESPQPRGPMSAAIFLHEIGHHAIGFGRYRPRCLEEYHAWVFSLDQMQRWDLNTTENVRKRMRESLAYAVAKAKRRGLVQVPPELVSVLGEGGLRRWE